MSLTAVLAFAASFVAGIATWTLLEYVLHRFGGHDGTFGPALRREHLSHHARPDTFSTWAKKCSLAAVLLGALALLLASVAPLVVAVVVTGGVTVTWLAYESLHRLIHVRAPRNAYGAWARRHHLHHHFHPRVNHGVTTSLWDHVFGTHEAPVVVTVPVRQAFAFAWLLDDDGSLARRWHGTYRLS